jgi:hypothetical protein
MKTAQIADEEFKATMGQLEDVRSVNVSTDLTTVHTLTLIHCIVSNPFLLARLVLFELQETLRFTAENCASLFETIVLRLTRRESTMLVQDRRRANLVVIAFLIDNLSAQSSGLDLFLRNTSEHSAIIHVHCFAHMINLSVSNPRAGEPFCSVFEQINALQLSLRTRDAVPFLGRKCLASVAARWLYLEDILKLLLSHCAQVNSHL